MPSDAKTRASDADRDRTAAALREQLAADRLTIEEFDQRLDQAYAAKTLGELDVLMADLPQADLVQFPEFLAARLRREPAAGTAGFARINPGRAGQVLRRVARSLGVLACGQPVRLRDLADQRRQRRPVVLVGGAAAGRHLAGALDHRRACAQRTAVSPAPEEPQASRRPGQAVTARAT